MPQISSLQFGTWNFSYSHFCMQKTALFNSVRATFLLLPPKDYCIVFTAESVNLNAAL